MTFTIRPADAADAPALAALHLETFAETHGGGPSLRIRLQQWHDILTGHERTDFSYVVEDDLGVLVAFARGTRHDGSVPGYGGELNKIYVLRRLHRHGLGGMLLCQVAGRFVAEGITSMLLFGDAHSSSNGFYEALGAERLLSPTGAFHGGYGWRDLHALLNRCAKRHGRPGPRRLPD